ncbi:MAG TPA: pyridoxal phosphate-dependent aminotransferase [Ktedonobacterales bacterium]|nr:pyridoxal phosphate-dependent aminotransferase [Ktedonobacterales bacterium]
MTVQQRTASAIPRSASRKSDAKTGAIRRAIADLRREYVQRAGEDPQARMAPIRTMARMISSVEAECRARGYPEAVVRAEVVNRSIGDVNLRYVVEHDAIYDYRTLADELGVALPGEEIGGVAATGERYRALRERMMEIERDLLARGYDVHMYDLAGTGNPLLREWICADQETIWGLHFTPAQVLVANGSLDTLDKVMRGLRMSRWAGPEKTYAVIFPAPGFNVPEWQAQSLGLTLLRVRTTSESGYRLTAEQLRETLKEHPEVRGVYLTLSNNPTAFSYSPEELRSLLDVVAEHPDVLVLADMAYTGTGDLAKEQARLRAFSESSALSQSIFFWSLSKVYTMTGDRFGYACVGDPALAPLLGISWVNGIASLPAEWQLRFTAFYEFLRQHSELRQKIGALYALRRRAFVRQLEDIDAAQHLFAQVNADDGGTVYNWSQLGEGENVFTFFEKTGIGGVPGSAFGYSDDHVRFSIGIVPVPGWERVVAEDPGTPPLVHGSGNGQKS